MRKYYNELFHSTPSTKCAALLQPQGRGGGEDKDFQCFVLLRNHNKKTCWDCTQKMSLRRSEVAWQDVRQVDQRLHELCSCKMNMEWSLPSMVLQCFHRFTSGAQEYSLLAGILVLSLKIFILRIHVYIGLLILYCNIRWAAETSRGWGIYF